MSLLGSSLTGYVIQVVMWFLCILHLLAVITNGRDIPGATNVYGYTQTCTFLQQAHDLLEEAEIVSVSQQVPLFLVRLYGMSCMCVHNPIQEVL